MSEQIKISQLPVANTVSGTTAIPVVEAGETQQATVDVLRAEIVSNAGNIVVDNITFRANAAVDGDESQILSVANSSGDLNGYTTLQLIPDASVVINDQYLIIDPTEPQHIHIRAGGTQDDSIAELFLGGESNFVRVIDGTGVRLQNRTRSNTTFTYLDPADFNTATWFESGGSFFVQFTAVNAEMGTVVFQIGDDDENTATVTYGGGTTATVTPAGSISNLGGGTYRFSVNEAPPASPTTLTGIEFEIWITRTNSVNLQNNDFSVTATDDIRIEAADGFSLRNISRAEPIEIRTDYDNANYGWEFGADGRLILPESSEANVAKLTSPPTAANVSLQLYSGNAVRIVSDSANNSPTWTFDTTGAFTAPGNISTANNVAANVVAANVFISPGPDLTIRSGVDNFGDPGVFRILGGNSGVGQGGTVSIDGGVGGSANGVILIGQNSTDVTIDGSLELRLGNSKGNVVLGRPAGTTTVYGSVTVNGQISVEDLSISGKLSAGEIAERFNNIANANGVVTHNCANNHIFNHSNIEANFTANFTNLDLNNGEATTLTLVLNQGATPYTATAVQIGGAAQTVKWLANAAPTGNANAVDVQSFSILNVGNVYTVLGQLTTFG